MKSSFWKRLFAFLIDMGILGIVLFLIAIVVPKSNNIKVLEQELNEITESVLAKEMDVDTYFARFASVTHAIDKENVMYGVFNSFLILGYFVILPYFWEGYTIGKKILKIKVVRKDEDSLTINDLLLRAFLNYGLLYMLVSLACVYVLKDEAYLIVTTILSVFQILVLILNGFMIIYRRDKRSLSDIFSKTKVIKVGA